LGFCVIIPARYGSTRLPGKPLRLIAGRPMLEHVYRRAIASGAKPVVIATDDVRIAQAAQDLGAQVSMTSPEHRSGTERLAEAVARLDLPHRAIIVNLQGDEPLMPPALLAQAAADLEQYPDAVMSTLWTPVHTAEELFSSHVVKAVTDARGYALYFSRAPIPWDRMSFPVAAGALPQAEVYRRHLGIYAYRAEFLREFPRLPACALEDLESLEQLRVDTEEDLARVEALLQAET
jgi:3-deoxy-manno-octulosonate cytidylyltransferase (CMP-KDO synthetase)